jgi:chemotaxis protein histidine kinase CheA
MKAVVGDYSMTVDPFTERLARVRTRFASALAGKIDEACAAIPRLSAAGPAAAPAAAVAETYRCVHGIVGVGPTVGFPASGNAAHDVEDVLRSAQQARRGLTADEIARLTKSLQVLREVSTRELQSFNELKS